MFGSRSSSRGAARSACVVAPASRTVAGLLAALAVFASPAVAAPDPPTVFDGTGVTAPVYVVITNEELVPSFVPLVQSKRSRGLPAVIVTVEKIQQSFWPAKDLPEAIRMFLQKVHPRWGLRFVLLGGDTDVVPARLVPNGFSPPLDDLNPVDLYYAALDGTWDADGDGIYGEWPDDNPDLEAELAIGRAPVSTPAEAAAFVSKTLDFQAASDPPFRDGVAFFCPQDEFTDWAMFGENVIAEVLDPAPVTLDVLRLYENHTMYPGSSPLDRSSALDALEQGSHGIIVHIGRGSADTLDVGGISEGNFLAAADFDALTNWPSGWVFTSYTNTIAPFDEECILEHVVLNPNGGAAAGLAHSGLVLPQPSHALHKLFLEEVFQTPNACIGTAAQRARTLSLGNPQAWRTAQTLTLLGDPELRVGPPSPAAVPRAGNVVPAGRRIEFSPNPFRGVTRIDLGGRGAAPVVLSVFDVTGRRLRVLEREGASLLEWDGRDASGRRAAPGTYFVRLEGGSANVGRVTLLR